MTADDPELDLFVKGVVAEMTGKAGQKCTAIRRAIVPEPMADTVVEALCARLARVTVGNPAAEGVRMGALVSLEQREEVRKAIQSLRASAEVVHGDPERAGNPDLVDADGERGAFLGPVLLRAARGAVEPHDVEAVRPGEHRAHLRLPRRRDRAGRPRPGQPGRLAGHPRPRGGAHGDPRARAVARPDPGARPRRRRASPPATASRCRRWCTAAPAAPAAARRWAACAASCT